MTDGIILAGGYSRRLGKNKMSILYQSQPVIMHTLRQMKEVCEHIYVVTGFYHDEISEIVNHLDGVDTVYNENYEQGMFSSVKKGVECVKHDFFIIPGDYPMVDKRIYEKIKLGTKGIRVPSFSFRLGHPIYFDYSFRDKIINTNLSSLKSFRNQYDFEIIEVSDDSILFDIDTLEDVNKLKEKEWYFEY